MKEPIMLDDEELQLIGEKRYREEHPFKTYPAIMLASSVLAILLWQILIRIAPGNPVFALAIVPIALSVFLGRYHSSKAQKAGKDFLVAHRNQDLDQEYKLEPKRG